MGEGAVVFLMKRLADAERDGDKIYAVLRGMGGSSDGKGKGITAPNPIGQKLAIERAWENAGLSPATATYMEGHGTSTRVGDVVEVESMADVLSRLRRPGRAGGAGLGEIQHRASEGRRRRRRNAEGCAGACATRCCRPACTASVRIPISTLPTARSMSIPSCSPGRLRRMACGARA